MHCWRVGECVRKIRSTYMYIYNITVCERKMQGRLCLRVVCGHSRGQKASSDTYRKPTPAVRLGGLTPLANKRSVASSCVHVTANMVSNYIEGLSETGGWTSLVPKLIL